MNHTCQCPGPGRCSVFQKDMVERQYQICSGNFPPGAAVLTEAVRLSYIQKWSDAVGVALPGSQAKSKPPRARPGTELKKLIESLGLEKGDCFRCRGLAAEMNLIGSDGCREHRGRILAQLREAAVALSWGETLRAAKNAVLAGLVLNPFDPAPGLLDEAIRRAEAIQREASGGSTSSAT